MIPFLGPPGCAEAPTDEDPVPPAKSLAESARRRAALVASRSVAEASASPRSAEASEAIGSAEALPGEGLSPTSGVGAQPDGQGATEEAPARVGPRIRVRSARVFLHCAPCLASCFRAASCAICMGTSCGASVAMCMQRACRLRGVASFRPSCGRVWSWLTAPSLHFAMSRVKVTLTGQEVRAAVEDSRRPTPARTSSFFVPVRRFDLASGGVGQMYACTETQTFVHGSGGGIPVGGGQSCEHERQ